MGKWHKEEVPGDGKTLIPVAKEETKEKYEQAVSKVPGTQKNGSEDSATLLTNTLDTAVQGVDEAERLLKRTPGGYFFNQVYGLWVYLSSFLLTALITREVSTDEYGVFAIAQTAINTILYIVAFGLEDATTTFLPRVFAEHGRAAAARLIRRLLGLRLLVLLACVAILLAGLPALSFLISLVPVRGAVTFAASLRNPVLLSHIYPIAVYVVGSSIGSLLTAVCAAQMRMQIVLVVGSATQFIVLGLGFCVLLLGWGINGVLWAQAVSVLFNAAAFALWLSPLLLTRGDEYRQPLKPVMQVGISAWLTNLASGALLKQVSIILLSLFAISLTQVGYFNLSFQIADAANLLLVNGFGGVSTSALAAAFVGKNYDRLGRSWQALIKIETLLAAPGLVFVLFNATGIARLLYGNQYAAVGPLLMIFLAFNLLVRISGAFIHQPSLYVVGKPRLVVLSQWSGLLVVILLGVVLVPTLGPTGALIADGVARLLAGLMLLAFLVRVLPRKYPQDLLSFTGRFMLALFLAALPSLLWHPTNQALLVVSGVIFVLLCIGLLLCIKPLSRADLEMLALLNPRIARYARWFARG